MSSNNFDWNKTKQISVPQLLLAFAVPGAIGYAGFRVLLPILVESGAPPILAWPIIASCMLFLLVIFALVLLQKEAGELNISLFSRMCLKNLSFTEWAIYAAIIVAGLLVTVLAGELVLPFMKITGLSVPDYMPFILNPDINPAQTDPDVLSPGYPLKGQFILLPVWGITLLLNILAEELYFRAWLLPKMAVYGNTGWIMNGTFFALYHTFQFWLFPVILTGSLFMAFVTFKSRSILPPMAGHFIANFIINILGLFMLILG